MRLTAPDLAVIAAYLAGVTWFGVSLRRGQNTIRDYFLGGRTAPWWALALSIVATETSTLTIIGTPALAFAGNLTFLQFVLGYLVGRIAIVLVILPHYFHGEFYTAYQLMERRFNARVKAVAASTFLTTRVLAEGVRIAAIALVVKAAIGAGQRTSILLIMALVLLYTFEGGMKAVIWTDVVQFLLYFSGSLVAFFLLLHQIPGGWHSVVQAAAPAHKFRILDFSFSFSNPSKLYTFWSGLVGGAFFTMGSHGTDQTIVQRLLAAKSERESKAALLASGVVILVQFSLFLVLGVMLYAWYGSPAVIPGRNYDSVFPDFIVTAMPPGVRGLTIAAILAVAMSNASGSLNSLAASSVVDFQELRGSPTLAQNPERFLRRSRWLTLVWGIALAALATLQWGPMLEAGLTIAAITLGSLLGIFLLTLLFPRATVAGTVAGLFVGLAAVLLVHFQKWLLWTWYVPFGAMITFQSGMLVSFLTRDAPTAKEPG
jgi:solute:Na+ symporter, SSS family